MFLTLFLPFCAQNNWSNDSVFVKREKKKRTWVAVATVPETESNTHGRVGVVSSGRGGELGTAKDAVKVPLHLGGGPLELVGMVISTGIEINVDVLGKTIVDLASGLDLVVKVGLHVRRILANDLKVDFITRNRGDQNEGRNRSGLVRGGLEAGLDRAVLHPARRVDSGADAAAGLGVLLHSVEPEHQFLIGCDLGVGLGTCRSVNHPIRSAGEAVEASNIDQLVLVGELVVDVDSHGQGPARVWGK